MTNKFIEQRVEALENELSELKLIVAQLRKPSTVVEEALANDVVEFEGKLYKKVDREAREGDVVVLNDVSNSHYFETNKPYKVQRDTRINGVGKLSGHKKDYLVYKEFHNRTPETVDVYELIVEDKPKTEFGIRNLKVITPNQLRAEIIEKAKLFLSEEAGTVFEFIVQGNRILVLNNEDKLFAESKCHPNDVFNEHIGKAIALGRALGLDVSEFEQAVQPTEFLIGHVVTYTSDEAGKFKGFEEEIESFDGKNIEYTNGESYDLKGEDWGIKIINDTSAQYEVNK